MNTFSLAARRCSGLTVALPDDMVEKGRSVWRAGVEMSAECAPDTSHESEELQRVLDWGSRSSALVFAIRTSREVLP